MKRDQLLCIHFLKRKMRWLTFLIFLGIASNVSAQTISVTGTVTDAQGEPMPGVNVVVKGTTTGAATDFDGKYQINAPSSDAVLSFSFIGFLTQDVIVGNQTTMNITLNEDTQKLEEVVVIGYGTAKKRDLTGSIVSIKGADVANKPMTNPTALIQGKVSGVQVVNSGQPGSEPDIRIRGTNSINGAKPLYIVDGLFNDNINFLNPADVESMEVLKDPSSLAIFGVRGANGVIIITTKRAQKGTTTVNVNSSVGFKQVVNKIKLTNAAQFKELYNEQLINQGVNVPYDYTNWQADTDWQDEIFQTGLVTQNNISISGAGEKNKFYMSVGYMMEEGIIRHEKLDKISLNVNDEYSVTDYLRFGFQFNGYKANTGDFKDVAPALKAAPIAPVFNDEYQLYHTLPEFQRAPVNNPRSDVEYKQNMKRPVEYRGVGNIYGEVDFLEHFNFRAAFSADYGFNQSRTYGPIVMTYNPEVVNAAPIDSLSKKTSISQSQNIYTKIQSDYLLTYQQQFDNHNITATAGFTTYYNSYSQVEATRNQGEGNPIPNDPRFWYLSMGDAKAATSNSGQWETTTVSFLMRALYNYKNKYLLNASFRRDGTSAFLGSNKWQSFGAVGAGWVMTEEEFMNNQRVLDYLKIKGSWGILGNQNIGDKYRYPALPALSTANSAPFGNNVIPAYSPEYLPYSNLHWETVHSWEAGFESYLLKNRLRLEAVYYHKLTKDLITEIPGIAGTTPGLGNLGEISNQGVELSASWTSRFGDDWTFTASGNLTTIDNKVKSLSTTGYAIVNGASRVTAGYPIGYFYGYKSGGIYQTKAEINQSPASKIGSVSPGDIKFVDTNGDNEITEADRTLIGNPTPDFTYGLSFNISYKNLDFGIDMMGVYGNEIYKAWNQNNYAQFNYQVDRMDRWNGVGTSNWEPILSTARSNNYQNSDYFIEDGSFFRIRKIQLGYNFSPATLSKVKVKGLRIYINVQNPVTFKNSTGYTPEIGGSAIAFGVDNGTYPIPAIFSLGLNLSF